MHHPCIIQEAEWIHFYLLPTTLPRSFYPSKTFVKNFHQIPAIARGHNLSQLPTSSSTNKHFYGYASSVKIRALNDNDSTSLVWGTYQIHTNVLSRNGRMRSSFDISQVDCLRPISSCQEADTRILQVVFSYINQNFPEYYRNSTG
jgi:hypothetical protein